MNIGVTGARGMVGRRLVEQLTAQGRAVSLFAGDIRDGRSVSEWVSASRLDDVVHLAAIVEVARAEANPVETFRTNVVGTINLMRALERAARPCWVFYTSSAHVYAGSAEAIGETHPVRPRGIYGQSKLLGEQAAQAFAEGGPIRLCIGRVFSLYDPEQTGSYLYPSVAARLRAHEGAGPLEICDGDAVRDFSSAGEIAAQDRRPASRPGGGRREHRRRARPNRDCADPVVVRRRGGFRGDANWPDQFGRGRYFQAQETSRWRRLAWRS